MFFFKTAKKFFAILFLFIIITIDFFSYNIIRIRINDSFLTRNSFWEDFLLKRIIRKELFLNNRFPENYKISSNKLNNNLFYTSEQTGDKILSIICNQYGTCGLINHDLEDFIKHIQCYINFSNVDLNNRIYGNILTNNNFTINGPGIITDGPRISFKALQIEGYKKFTRINLPPTVLNLREGTISIWAKLSDPKKMYSTLIRVNCGNSLYIYHGGGDGYFTIYFNKVLIGKSFKAIGDNLWHHYLLMWKDKEQYFYINGKLSLTGKCPSPYENTINVALGWLGTGDTEQWHGDISELFILNKILNLDKIVFLYGLKISGQNPAADPETSR